MKPGSQVKVIRTSGEMDEGWFLWTNVELPAKDSSWFSAPEVVHPEAENMKVLVVKPPEGVTADDILSGEWDGDVLKKNVRYSDLLKWNEA